MSEHRRVANEINTAVAHPARMYDYYLGGKDSYLADRVAVQKVLRVAPEVRLMAWENRRFLGRAVRYLVADAGIRQIIDIGVGLPAAGNVHEVAREIAPETRVVYADNDPMVLAHANALLAGSGPTCAVPADLRKPEEFLDDPTVRELIDFNEPVGLLLVAVLHFLTDGEEPAGIVRTLLAALPVGSFLVVSHATGDLCPEVTAQVATVYDTATSTLTVRSHAEISAFFNGCELVDPGLVRVPVWRPDDKSPKGHTKVWIYGGVGRKI
nr:SAM-dependent methyltransferase [Frankia sp. CiP3]